tara:strand:+ start:915 stop:1730 length:816 start_codon:yes stop_codon:yes gene_type:complete
MDIKYFFDNETATFTYVVSDPKTKICAVIDPVLNFELSSNSLSTGALDKIERYLNANQLQLEWILETHVHADHLTGAKRLQEKLGGRLGISNQITKVQSHWAPEFPETLHMPTDGSQFDTLFADNDHFSIGELNVAVMHTPGHTPACSSYLINDTVFVGDTIFMPYVGTARTDFPGGSAATLYDSIQRLLSLPSSTKIYVGHDYPEKNNQPKCLTTVQEQQDNNVMINKHVNKETFVEKRNTKDKNKQPPKLLLPALQANICAGQVNHQHT